MSKEIDKEIEEMSAAREAYNKLMRENGEALVKRIVTRMFEVAEGKLGTVAWTQWAPHFNDGDPCTFSVHERGYYAVDAELGRYHEEASPEDIDGLTAEQVRDINKLDGQLGCIDDDVFERLFDDAEVRATMVNGELVFKTEYREHD